MAKEPKHKLRVFSHELNELLNYLHEASKKHERASESLVFKNAVIYLFRFIIKIFSWKGFFAALIPVSMIALMRDSLEELAHLPFTVIFILSGVLFALFSALLRHLVLDEMSRIGSEFFHIEIFEKRRGKEYSALISLAKEKDFVFTLKKELERELIQEKDEKLRKRVAQQQKVIKENEEAIEELLDKLTASEELANLFNERSELALNFLFGLKNKLTLLVRDQFNLDNINFGVNYSLYRIENSGLSFIDGYGINKAEFEEFIPFKQVDNKFIQAINASPQKPLVLEDFIAWKRVLQDEEQWVISLHLDDSNRSKLKVGHETGQLNISLIQELLWICCELLNKFSAIHRSRQKGEH
ncbi:hypothetical protein K8O68_01625 [Salipaludibacillus sp. CUR1]|uniref:hypothetical protein n=1 Tax=Salipaludibacillus sp. CUR1 TaxID=2820003 RepID=UPI001E450970|nr:hypothetical protein [Salipaludibacillus sp. CUR1]MCE7791115.1 hypothetical protein [Salipaludibacillus sp. CUR1]